MAANLRTRQNGKRVFQLSGFSDDERKEMGKMVARLGGIDFDSQGFRSNCTHVVCKKLSRSEKFLGGCATAKWILHPDYILESSKAGQWLEEQCYDWSQINTPDAADVPAEVREAPRRWRYHFEVFGTTAFAGWKTAVVVSGARKNSVYKSLLHSGGAEVYNLKLPVTQPEKVTNALTYVFANEKCAIHVAHLIEYGVLCLRPEYIGDYLIKDPQPDPLDYLVKVPQNSIFQGAFQNDSVVSSQTSDLELSQHVGPLSSQNTPERRYLSIPGLGSTSSVPSPLAIPNRLDISESDLDFPQRFGSSSCLNTPEKAVPSISELASSSSRLSPLKISNRQVTRVSDRVTRNNKKGVQSPLRVKPVLPSPVLPVQKKRKASEVEGIEDAFQELKKLKWSCVVSNSMQQPNSVPMEFSVAMTNFIHTSLEEETCSSESLSHAIDLISSMIVSTKYPKIDTIHFMMVMLLQNAACESLAMKSYTALMKLLQVHPPTSPALINMYMKTLMRGTEEIDDSNQPWQFIRTVIQNIIEQPLESESAEFTNNFVLLEFVVALLEQNFKFCVHRFTEIDQNNKKLLNCMITRVLWPGSSQFTMNAKCHDLLSFLSSCVSSNLYKTQKMRVLPVLLSLISMVGECCRLAQTIPNNLTGSLLTSKEEGAIAFVQELSRNIDVSHTDEELLGLILRSLQPAWLCLYVCLSQLNILDDYLVLEGLPRDDIYKISLHTIVTKYFFLLPKLQLLKEKQDNGPKTVVSTRKRATDMNDTMASHSKENKFVKDATKANKRNVKGETSLHKACIKNDVINLRKLLKIPGIDINAKDNAGWTPLHEACNHGHIQCVKELLSFVPSKTVDTFFSSGDNVCRKADLLLSNNEGITPLHDAVMNDRLDVCRLLLQHGGKIHCIGKLFLSNALLGTQNLSKEDKTKKDGVKLTGHSVVHLAEQMYIVCCSKTSFVGQNTESEYQNEILLA
ncbi:LOW QUALITY PROTEIN: SMC5-SMC6 complex localization factor protein 1-like [Argopecten irradians]|uniref:LOW QUALITY PROTEIN: SMC5-SMC6 complex localization factor protein 1-like n=1 Tax=Argopecten irradians TaxID=31199 RepID=UPI00371D5C75